MRLHRPGIIDSRSTVTKRTAAARTDLRVRVLSKSERFVAVSCALAVEQPYDIAMLENKVYVHQTQRQNVDI